MRFVLSILMAIAFYSLFIDSKKIEEYQISNNGITITAYDYLAGAIGSVKWKGVEFIDNVHRVSDHGRQLQSAIQVNQVGEANNPTEAGADHIIDRLIPFRSSSKLLSYSIEDSILRTKSQMAYFKGYQGKVLSDYVMDKEVSISNGGIIDYNVTFHIPEETNHLQIEALTGYMPYSFKEFWALLPNGELLDLDEQFGEQKYPVIVSNQSGSYAMGIKTDIPNPGYGLFSFHKEKVRKWNVVWRETEPEAVAYSYLIKLYIGTLSDVKEKMLDNEK